MLNISEIIHRSWKVTKENRYIWWLGLLTIFASGPTTFFQFKQDKSVNTDFVDKIDFNQSTMIAIAFLAILFILIGLTIMYYAYSARAGVIKSIISIENKDKKHHSFKLAIKAGEKFVWRQWGLNIMVCLMVLGLCLLVYVFFSLGTILGGFGFIFDILGIVWILVLIPVIFMLVVSSNLASIDLVIHDRTIIKALERGWQITRVQIKNSLYVTIVAAGLNVLLMLGVYLGLILIIIPCAILVFFLTSIFPWWIAAIALSPVGIIILILMAIILSMFSAFIVVYFTYSYLALEYLANKKKD